MQSITLTITNIDRLPDGGPISYTATGQRFEIGRDPFRDWSLPDPQLYISGRHCEIVPSGDGYMLNDVSRNGVFVNGAQQRVKSPYLLRDGDVLGIGNYFVSVRVSPLAGRPVASGSAPEFVAPVSTAEPLRSMPANSHSCITGETESDDIWGTGPATGPSSTDQFQPASAVHREPDFVESHLDMPVPQRPQQSFSRPSTAGTSPAEGSKPDPFVRQPASSKGAGSGELLAAFCDGAKIAPNALAQRDQAELFREIGTMMMIVSEAVAQLLRARASARAMVKTSERTMISAEDNNPLKFLPGSAEALEAMLVRNRMGFLDGTRAFRQAFEDLKRHEMATYAAMQRALARLLDDLSPESIEAKVSQSRFSNNKAKAWEVFVARWEAKTEASANGMLDVFLAYFSEAYQQMSEKDK